MSDTTQEGEIRRDGGEDPNVQDNIKDLLIELQNIAPKHSSSYPPAESAAILWNRLHGGSWLAFAEWLTKRFGTKRAPDVLSTQGGRLHSRYKDGTLGPDVVSELQKLRDAIGE